MPFICLANTNIVDGVLQITDLWPNVSQDNNPTNPPGQNRYLRRPATPGLDVNSTAGTITGFRADASAVNLEGLGAYLFDKVEPGSLEVSTATVTLNTVLATDRMVVKGIVFEFAAGANDLAGKAGTAGDPFLVGLGADDDAAAANLILALNDAADVGAAMDVPAPVGVHVLGATPGAPSNIVIVTASDIFGPAPGNQGDLTFVSGTATLVITPAAALATGRMIRTQERWDNATIAAAVTAIQGRVDAPAGASMTLAQANILLTAAVNGDLDGTGATSGSVGSLTELLSVLAGRTYRVPSGSVKFTSVTVPDTVHVWSATLRGAFTTPNITFDTGMLSGEWGPITGGVKALKTGGGFTTGTFLGGDVVNNEIGEARATFDTTHFQNSVQTGQLSRYAAGIALFPDPEVQNFVSDFIRRTNRQAPLVNQRIVTVYDDDGTLLV